MHQIACATFQCQTCGEILKDFFLGGGGGGFQPHFFSGHRNLYLSVLSLGVPIAIFSLYVITMFVKEVMVNTMLNGIESNNIYSLEY